MVKTLEMSRNKELHNKLRIALSKLDPVNYSKDQFIQILDLLKKYQSLSTSSQFAASGDQRIIENFFSRNLLHLTSIGSKEDFSQYLQILEKCIEMNPSEEREKRIISFETTYAFEQAYNKIKLDLEDIVKYSTLMNLSTHKPDFFFSQILHTKYQTFKDIKPDTLDQFVSQIVYRANQDKFMFEHLKESSSKIHAFVPYTEKTM